MSRRCLFFDNASARSVSYTYCHNLSLHDALPICSASLKGVRPDKSAVDVAAPDRVPHVATDRGTAPRKRAQAKRATRKSMRATPGKPASGASDAYPFTHPERLIFDEPKIRKAEKIGTTPCRERVCHNT